MPAELIDGTAVARAVRVDVAVAAAALVARGVRPGLAVVLVGDDPASAVYVPLLSGRSPVGRPGERGIRALEGEGVGRGGDAQRHHPPAGRYI